MSEEKVLSINKGWCSLCCSNLCYCSLESLKKQLRLTLDGIKERNEEIANLKSEVKAYEIVARDWMKSYDELKEKYEPLELVLSGEKSYDQT